MGDSNPNRYTFQQRTGNQQQNDQAAFYQQQYMAQDNNRPLFSQKQQSNQQMMGNGSRTTPLPNAQMLYYQLQQQQQNPMQFQQFQQQQRMLGQRPDLGQSNAPTVSLNATNAQALYYQQLQQQMSFNNAFQNSMAMNGGNWNVGSNANSFASNTGIHPQQVMGGQGTNTNGFGGNGSNSNQIPLQNVSSAHPTHHRQNSFKTFEGTAHSNLNDRQQFENVFHNYLIQRNINPNSISLIGQQPFDAFSTLHVALQYGGFETMQKQNLWSTILQKLGLEVNQMNAHVLMNNYSNFLLPLETMVSPFARKGSNQSQSPDISSNMSTRTPQLPPNPLANHQAQIASMKNNISPQMGVGDMSMSSNTIQHQLNNSAAQIVQQNQMNLIIQQQQQQKLLQNQIQQDSHLQQQIQAPNESSRAIAATATSPAMQPPSPNVMIKSETSNVPSEAPSYPDQKNDSVVKTELTEEESKYYFTKTRKLNTFGGIDLVSLGPALQRMKASKEQYAPRDLKQINIFLKSRLDFHVRYALDTLLIYSSENTLRFDSFPELLDTICEFMLEVFYKVYPIKTQQSTQRFYTYKELYELEFISNSYLQDNCDETLCTLKQHVEELCAMGLILRNVSLVAENQPILSKHVYFLQLIYKTLDTPVSDKLKAYFDGDSSSFPVTVPFFNTLELRKNALLSLSCIANEIQLPDKETAQLILSICSDFISELDMYYVYPAVDTLARLYLNPCNLALFSECNDLKELSNYLLKLLPQRGFTYDTTPNQMAQYELVLMVLCTTVQMVDEELQRQIIELPYFLNQIGHLAKRPITVGLHMRQPPPELINQFFPARERAFKTYLQMKRIVTPQHKLEKELMMDWMYRAEREGDTWMVQLIVEFMAEF